jgi:hypothetical protein
MALAENSGLSPIETLASIKSRQVKEKNSRLGVDCMQLGSNGKPLGSSVCRSPTFIQNPPRTPCPHDIPLAILSFSRHHALRLPFAPLSAHQRGKCFMWRVSFSIGPYRLSHLIFPSRRVCSPHASARGQYLGNPLLWNTLVAFFALVGLRNREVT